MAEKTIKVKMNLDLPGFYKGQELTVHCDENGIPLEQAWRRKLKDAKIDHCCTVLTSRSTPSKKKTSYGKNTKKGGN